MRNLINSIFIITFLAGCSTSYNTTNCNAGTYAHCDTDRAVAVRSDENKDYVIRNNLLFLTTNGVTAGGPASKEEVLDFALNNAEYIVMYDPVIDVATVHRRVYDFEGRTAEGVQAVLGTALVIVGTAAVVALALDHRSCYDRHISGYRSLHAKTQNNIWNSDAKGVGSKKWHADINESQSASIRELNMAFGCLQ